MINFSRGGVVTSYYCTCCHWATRTEFHRPPPVMGGQLVAFVDSLVPRYVWAEVREEVKSDILISILETRHRANGYRLVPALIDGRAVTGFIKAARKRLNYRFVEYYSIHANEMPLSERLAG